MALSVALAVEKVLFRLALIEGGAVPVARAFLELPLSLEEIEEYADQIADGLAVVRNDFGEFLSYEFPELSRQVPGGAPDDCPLCGGERPPAPTEGGVEQRQALICDSCYRRVRRLNEHEPDEGVIHKLKSFFRGEEEEDLVQIARTEHEIFYMGLKLGIEQFTHTSLAAQSRLPSSQLKERLDRLAGRRYIQHGLLPSGDAVAYRFPPDTTYPRAHYRRFDDSALKSGKVRGLQIDNDDEDDKKEKEKKKKSESNARTVASRLIRPILRRKKPDIRAKIKIKRRPPNH